jgi:hypothetical protein
MNVFVLCTGRSGSTTFTEAARRIANFTAAHESRCHFAGAARLAYPPRHIEIDNRLSWMLGRLDRAYGDAAHYVHLVRDPEATAASFTQRTRFGIMRAYRNGVMQRTHRNPKLMPLDVARDLVDTVTENIRLFLRDKTHVMTFRTEEGAQDFARFWDWIGATGDRDAALAEWRTLHNAAKAAAPEAKRRRGRRPRGDTGAVSA